MRRPGWLILGVLVFAGVVGAAWFASGTFSDPESPGWSVGNSSLTVGYPVEAEGADSLESEAAVLQGNGASEEAVLSLNYSRYHITEWAENRTKIENPVGGDVVYRESRDITNHSLVDSNVRIWTDADPAMRLSLRSLRIDSPLDIQLTPAIGNVPETNQTPLCVGKHPRCGSDKIEGPSYQLGVNQTPSGFSIAFRETRSGAYYDGVRLSAIDAAKSFRGAAREDENHEALVHQEKVRYLLTHGTGGSGTVNSTEAVQMKLLQPSIRSVDTTILHHAKGRIQVAGETIVLHGETIEIIGNTTVTLAGGDDGGLPALDKRTTVSVGGTAQQIRVAGDPYTPNREPLGEQAVLVAALVFLLTSAWKLKPYLAGALSRLYTRIDRSELLDNELRQELLDHIESRPGIHFRALGRLTGTEPGALQHHLQKLEEYEFIQSERKNGLRVFFRTGTDPSQAHAKAILENETRSRIAGYLSREGPASQQDIAKAAGISQSTVSYHLSKMVAESLVLVREAPLPKHYRPSPALIAHLEPESGHSKDTSSDTEPNRREPVQERGRKPQGGL